LKSLSINNLGGVGPEMWINIQRMNMASHHERRIDIGSIQNANLQKDVVQFQIVWEGLK